MFMSRKLRMLTWCLPIIVLAFGAGCKSCKKPPKTDATTTPVLTPGSGGPKTQVNPVPAAPKDMENAPPEGEFFADPNLKTVYFDFDKFNIRDDQVPTVEANAGHLKQNAGKVIRLEGHCDERGTEEYNVGLGDRRARSVKNQLVYLGVDANRIFTVSFGEMKSTDQGHTEDAWAKNRRVEFMVKR